MMTMVLVMLVMMMMMMMLISPPSLATHYTVNIMLPWQLTKRRLLPMPL